MSAAEGQSVAAAMTVLENSSVKTLQSLRSEEKFWEEFTRLLMNLKWNIPHYHAKEGHVDDMILVQVKEIIQEMYKI